VNSGLRIELALSAALFLALAGCSSEPEVTATEQAPVEAPSVNVTVVQLQLRSLSDRVALAGRLDPWVEVEVSTELGGTVQEIGFDKGERVRKGQVLARIGTDLLQAALDGARAELTAAEANYSKSNELFQRQAVPRQDLIAATSTYESAKARTKQAELRVERSIIRAPISGVAIRREIEVGEVVPPGSLVTTIDQLSRLKASVGIPEDDISFFRVGSAAVLDVDAYPDQAFEGTIHFLGPAASGLNRTFPAEIEIDNRESLLRPGMIVRVSLVKRVFTDAIVVPRDAIVERDTGNVAFVLDGDRAKLRNVKTGPSEGGEIVILEGLEAGEALIVTGHRNLVDGQRVRTVGESPAE
jgi:membrane fusion protein (multidrug efflux system)